MRLLLFLFLFPCLGINAQFLFETNSIPASFKRNSLDKLSLGLEFRQTLRNTEYFGKTAKGFTAFENTLEPFIAFLLPEHLEDQFRIEAGAVIQYFSGKEEEVTFRPSLQFRWLFNSNAHLNIGRINSGLQHNLTEALYAYDRHYIEPIENGIQFVRVNQGHFTDLWVNWQDYIQPKDSFQEQFTVGFSEVLPVHLHSSLTLNTIIQGYFYHRGGQIDASDLPILSTGNIAIGGNLLYDLRKEIEGETAIGIKYIWHGYNKFSGPSEGPNHIAYTDGNAYLIGLNYQQNNALYAELGYWQTNEFWSPLGESLIHSTPHSNPSIGYDSRSYIIQKLSYRVQSGVKFPVFLSARFDGYYSLDDQKFEYGIGLAIRAFVDQLL